MTDDLTIQQSNFSVRPWIRRLPCRPDVVANEWGEVSDELIWEESWTQNVYQLNPDWLRGQTVIDLGANIGAFTLLVLSLLGTERVVAVEPEPVNRSILEQNIAINGWSDRVDVLPVAVGRARGTCSMVGAGGVAATAFGAGEIPVVTLSDLLEPYDEVDLLKIDIEGAEWDAFGGSWDSVHKLRWIVGEWHPASYEVLGDFLAHLSDTHSYSIIGRPHTGGQIWAHRHEL